MQQTKQSVIDDLFPGDEGQTTENQSTESFSGIGGGDENFRKLYNEFQARKGKQTQEQPKDPQERLNDAIKTADALSIYMLHPKDIDKMTSQEKRVYHAKIDATIKTFNTIKTVSFNTIDPYKLHLKQELKKARKAKDQLESSLEGYVRQLKGYVPKDMNADFFATVVERLPESIKNDGKYSAVMEYLNNKGGKKQEGNGYRTQLRNTVTEARFLRSFHDSLNQQIVQYKNQISEIKEEIGSINGALKNNPANVNELLDSRSEKSSLLNQYEREHSKLEDTYEEVTDQLIDKAYEVQFLQSETKKQEAYINQTRNSLRGLQMGIKKFEAYLKQKNSALAYATHLGLVRRAQETGVKLAGLNILGDAVNREEMDVLTGTASNDGSYFGQQDNYWSQKSDEIRNKDMEMVENLKENLDDLLY